MRQVYVGGGLSPGEMISFRKKVAEKIYTDMDNVIITAVCMHYIEKLECDGKCAFNNTDMRLTPAFEVFFYRKGSIEAEFIDKMPEELRDDYFKLCALLGLDDKWAYTWYINGKERYLCNRNGEVWLVDDFNEVKISI